MSREIFIWCDESIKQGEYYSNFYGGVLVASKDLTTVNKALDKVVTKIGITKEIKWGKVDTVKLPAFKELMNVFFTLVKKNKIKVRIMCRHNARVARNLSHEQKDNEFFILYYQFIKHSFGLIHHNLATKGYINLRLHFDYLPDTVSKVQQFKEYIKGLERLKSFQDARIRIKKEDITEVDSKKHLLMQFLDVVLGSMQFRLNNKHLEKPTGKKRRGKRTIAKEKLYKHINKKIREIRKGFNIGMSTGCDYTEERWEHPYRHWCFIPKDFEIDERFYK
jgi:hypothetical protein